MKRITRFVGVLLFVVFGLSISSIAEEITLTTYYPAPYGEYEELRANKFAVGSTATMPTTDGEFTTIGNTYLATDSGNVGIGTADLTENYFLKIRSPIDYNADDVHGIDIYLDQEYNDSNKDPIGVYSAVRSWGWGANAIGVYGDSYLRFGAYGANENIGVKGRATGNAGSGGGINIGVWGEANDTANVAGCYGVYGKATGGDSAQRYGGYFEGKGYFSGNVGIGTTSPAAGYMLDVQGSIQATAFDVGDITFRDQKSNQILWRMFEDEDGLYLENIKTGKIYRFLLQELEK